MGLRKSFRHGVTAVKEAVSRSASKERNPGDQSDLEVIDGQAKADIEPSSSKALDAVPQNIENPKEIPEVTVSSPEKNSQDRRNDADVQGNTEAQGKAGNSDRYRCIAPGETPPQEVDVAESSRQDTEAPAERLTWDNLWEEAYVGLESNAEHADLLTDFELHLLEGEDEDNGRRSDGKEPPDGTKKLKKIQALAQNKLDKLPEARLSFTVGNKKVVVRETVRKTVDVISRFKDIINPVLSAEPCSAVAWGGIMAILPLVENALQEDDNAASGLKDIVFLLIRYQRLQEEVLAPETQSTLSATAREVFSNIRSKLIDIYTKVYVYEIRFVLQYRRNRAHRTTRDMVVTDGWKEMWSSIESAGRKIDQAVQEHVSARSLEAMNDITTRTENIEVLQRETLESVEDGNRTNLMMSLKSAPNAIFDSAVIVGAEAACLKGTQSEILNTIQDWAENPAGEIIFWLHGMAGTGKTSVALAVANALDERQPFTDGRKAPRATFLGASFFFKQGDSTRNTTERFFSTLARSLAQEFADLRVHITNAVAKNLDIGSKAPQQQLDGLVFQPLSVVDGETLLPVRLIVVVDALDECIQQQEVNNLVGMLRVLEQLHRVQLRVLITSRRDAHIHRSFKALPETMYRRSQLSKVRSSDKESETDDITFYLTHTLGMIAAKRDVPPSWIGQEDIAKLSRKADGLFIYAATLCRFLDTEDFTDEEARQDRLDQIFSDDMDEEAPQHMVDEIYLKVLSFPHIKKSSDRFKKRFFDNVRRILGFIAVLFEPASISSLSALLPLDVDKLEDVLRRLYSVLDVREDRAASLGLVHLSFRDFLLSERSRHLNFQVEENLMHRAVFDRCLDIMSENLRQNMSDADLPGDAVSRTSTDGAIPRHLRYACRYWVDHLAKLHEADRRKAGLEDNGAVHVFLREKLMFWLEAMGLIRETSTAVLIVNRLYSLVGDGNNANLSGLIYNAKRFILGNRWVIENAPLQLYSSAIVFSPAKSLIRSHFSHLIPSWVIQQPELEEHWTPEYSVLEAHTARVRSLAFSPVDNLLASSSKDRTTRVWDYVIGTELYSFHEPATARSIAFSADGKRIALAFEERSHGGLVPIRVRNLSEGTAIDLMHSSEIKEIVFPPDSNKTLVSLGWDCTVCTWNIDERRIVRSIDPAQEKEVLGSWLSPSGKSVLLREESSIGPGVGIYNIEDARLRAIFLWDIYDIPGFFVSATDDDTVLMKYGPAYSESLKLVYGSTAQIEVETPYQYRVERFVSCPPKGELVAMITKPGTIEIHMADTWQHVGTLDTNGELLDLAFSRDGRFLAGSYKHGAIRLWDMTTPLTTPSHAPDYQRSIRSVKFLRNDEDTVITTDFYNTVFRDTSAKTIMRIEGSSRKTKASPDGNVIGICRNDPDPAFQLWTKGMTRCLASYSNGIGIKFSPDSSRMALLLVKRGARLLDAATLENLGEIDCECKEPLAFSPNGKMVCWVERRSGDSGHLHVSDVATGKTLLRYPCNTECVNIKFSPDGELVAFERVKEEERHASRILEPTQNRVIFLLEVATGRERAVTTRTFVTPDFVAFHPKGHVFAMVEGRENIEIWDTASGSKEATFGVAWPTARSVAISRTGKLVAASRSNKFKGPWIQVWDLATGAELGLFGVHSSSWEVYFWEVAFSGDSNYVETEIGRLPAPSRTSTSDGISQEEADLSLYVDGQWLMQGFDKLLWLPPAYRELVPAITGSSPATVAFARPNGQVAFLKLDLAKTPLAYRGASRTEE